MQPISKPFEATHFRVNTYETCPKKYYFEYIDEYISAHKRELRVKRPDSTLGINVHDTLKYFFKLPLEVRTAKRLTNILWQVWGKTRGKKGGFENDEQEREYYKRALIMLSNFYKKADLNPKIFYLPVDESYKDLLKVPYDKDLVIGGKIDRIDKNDDGTLRIIDYKTGKEKDDRFQIAIYGMVAERYFNIPTPVGSLYYLFSGTVKIIEINEELKSDTVEWIKTVIKKITSDTDFDPRVSKLCGWCDYVRFCPMKKEVEKLLGGKKAVVDTEDIPF